jgi:hypothetical protein
MKNCTVPVGVPPVLWPTVAVNDTELPIVTDGELGTTAVVVAIRLTVNVADVEAATMEEVAGIDAVMLVVRGGPFTGSVAVAMPAELVVAVIDEPPPSANVTT